MAMLRKFMGVVEGEEFVGKHCVVQCLETILLGVAMVRRVGVAV